MTTLEKPYDLIKQYIASLNEHDQQVIKEFHAVKMRAYRKKNIEKVSIGRPKKPYEEIREKRRITNLQYRQRIRDEKIANGTYRSSGRPKLKKEEEKVEVKED